MKKVIFIWNFLIGFSPLTVIATTTTSNTTLSETGDLRAWFTFGASIFAALGSLISIYFQRKNHKEQIRSQLIAASRIKWTEEVRRVFEQYALASSDLNTAIIEYRDYVKKNKKSERDSTKLMELSTAVSRTQTRFWSKSQLFLTYFVDSEENKEIRECIGHFGNYLNKYKKYVLKKDYRKEFFLDYEELKNKSRSSYYHILLKRLSNELSIYLKNEWEKVKLDASGKRK